MNIQKILLVDDDPTILLITQIGIETKEPNWKIVLASSGEEAIAKAIEEKPDLIVLDMVMPGMDGKSTLTKLQQNNLTVHIPVIFLTGKIQKQEIDNYIQLGALGVIPKPFDPMAFSGQVSQIIYNKR